MILKAGKTSRIPYVALSLALVLFVLLVEFL